jgi:Flp pilus assembly protein TadG
MRLLRDRRCATSLELSFVAAPFFAMMLGLMEMGYDLFVQAALDIAVERSARQVQIGAVKSSGESSSALAAAAVCPNLYGLLNCNLLIVGVVPVPSTSVNGVATEDYYQSQNLITYSAASSTNGDVSTGSAGQMMVLEAWYNGPTFVGTLIPGWNSLVNGKRVHVTLSTAGFVNEYF